MVLPRRIELPTPSLPRTCSTTELRQRLTRAGRIAPGKRRGQCHFGPPKARPGKTRTFCRFHQFSIVQPSFDHGGPVTNAPGDGSEGPESTWGEHSHDHRDAGLVAGVPEPAATSPRYPRLSAPDGRTGRTPRDPLTVQPVRTDGGN